MNIANEVYFAPGIRFVDVDYDGPELPDRFAHRMDGYYLRPARILIDNDAAFGAGVLLVSMIDALARFKYPALPKVGDRFREFARLDLASFSAPGDDQRFYDRFRNGIVHESRIKAGSQFSFERPQTVTIEGVYMVINPKFLFDEVADSLKAYHALLKSNNQALAILVAKLKSDHVSDPQFPPP
jgi:hypothetical protein